tara:strand:- start:442 stop:1149 length:708 start_codon:yes stop_codon:yes gene_type:complete
MALPQVNSSRYSVFVPGLNKEVEFRPYLVKEEKILMMAMESSDQKQILGAIKDVIEACVFDNINVNNLAVFDLEILFLHLRAKSVGERINVNMKCQGKDCGVETPIEIDLEDIKAPSIEPEDKIVMLSDEIGMTLRYPSFKDIQKFDPEYLEKIDGIMELLVLCIENIFDTEEVYENSTNKEKMEFIENLNTDQFQTISKFFDGMPSLKHDVEFTCIKCEKENKVELRGIQSFFT